MNDLIKELEAWYHEQCDGDREHGSGVRVETLDNPGWHLQVNLEGTALESIPFAEQKVDCEHESNWIICARQGNTFDAAGGPRRLGDMIGVFLAWVKSNSKG